MQTELHQYPLDIIEAMNVKADSEFERVLARYERRSLLTLSVSRASGEFDIQPVQRISRSR